MRGVSVFRSVYSSFHNRLEGACLLFGVLFSQFRVRVWGWVSYRFLPFTVFSLGLPFCFSSYIFHLRCTSEGVVSIFKETSHSFFVWGSS